MAMTGFAYTFNRVRTARPLGMFKYDPIGTSTAAFCFDMDISNPTLGVPDPTTRLASRFGRGSD